MSLFPFAVTVFLPIHTLSGLSSMGLPFLLKAGGGLLRNCFTHYLVGSKRKERGRREGGKWEWRMEEREKGSNMKEREEGGWREERREKVEKRR